MGYLRVWVRGEEKACRCPLRWPREPCARMHKWGEDWPLLPLLLRTAVVLTPWSACWEGPRCRPRCLPRQHGAPGPALRSTSLLPASPRHHLWPSRHSLCLCPRVPRFCSFLSRRCPSELFSCSVLYAFRSPRVLLPDAVSAWQSHLGDLLLSHLL